LKINNTNLYISDLYLLTRLVLTILIENKIFPRFEVHVTYEEFCWTEGTIRVYFYNHELKRSFSPFSKFIFFTNEIPRN